MAIRGFRGVLVGIGLLSCACTAEEAARPEPAPEIKKETEAVPEQVTFLAEKPRAVSAIGTWTQDAGASDLTLVLGTSDLGCSLNKGAMLQFAVVKVDATTLVTQMQGEKNMVTWQRVGTGTGLPGSWRSTDDKVTYLLTLRGDGGLVLSVDGLGGANCGGDGPMRTGYVTDDGCYVDDLPTVAIVADGTFADWAGAVTVEDPDNDSSASSTADELDKLMVAGDEKTLGIRVVFAEPIGGTVPAPLNYEVGFQTEKKLGSFRVRVEPQREPTLFAEGIDQAMMGTSGREFEVTIPWASIGGKGQLFRLDVRVTSDNRGNPPLDDGLCFSEANPP